MQRTRSRAARRAESKARDRQTTAPGGRHQHTLGGATLTQNPARPTKIEEGGEKTGVGASSWDHFAGYPTWIRVRLYWQANPGLRDFLLYIVFVVVFSIVSFASKPGEVQFHINKMHKENLGRGLDRIGSHSDLYKWLESSFADQAFPMFSPDDEPWGEVERLMVSGQARVMGAMRLRQVRSVSRDCDVKEEMLQVDGYEGEVLCEEEYSFSNRNKEPIHAEGSAAKAQLRDFTRPFTFQSASDLNTTLLFSESGDLDTYYQDGYALDVVPNVPPNTLANYFLGCESIMIESVGTCMEEQNVFLEYEEEGVPSPPPPPSPPPIDSDEEPMIAIFTDADDDGQPTERDFFLERTLTLTPQDPEEEVQFQLVNSGVLTIDWEVLFFNSSDTLLERWQEDVPWLSQDLNEAGTLECTDASCEPVRYTVTVRAGQVNYLLTDDFVLPGQRKHAPNSPLDIVFRGQSPWELKQATLRLNVFLDRTDSATRRHLASARQSAQEWAAESRRKLRQAEEVVEKPCERMSDIQKLVPAALDTDKCQQKPDPLDICKLDYVAFQQMYQFMGPSKCQGCECTGPTDRECVQSCSAKDLFKDQVDDLRDGQWLDEHSRAVILDVNLLNANYNLFSNVRIVVEFQTTGFVNPAVRVRTFKLFRYQTDYDYFIAVMEVAFVVLVVYYIYQETVEIYRQRWSYFKHGWNYVDWANLIIALAVIGLRIVSLTRLNAFVFDSTSVQYIDFPSIGAFANQELNIIALNFFLIYFKIFKYMANVPRMDSILHTLREAAVDLLLFMVLVLIIYFGFSAAFFVCFGHEGRDFRTLADSVGALNRVVLGDFDYDALNRINSTMASVLFFSFVLVVVFVVLSMFLALISDAYREVKADEPDSHEFFTAITTRLFKRAEDVQELQTQLKNANLDGDTRVSMEELEYALRDNPKAIQVLRTTSVAELMAKYDMDDDGVLDKEELCSILAELAEKEAEIQETIDEREKAAEGMVDAGRAMTPEERARVNNKRQVRAYHARLDRLGNSVKELSKNIAKKLSTMIDLMVSLSDQISREVPTEVVAPTWAR